ncbi:MAG: histone-lysine N-methyltransferase, partial [Candidatus Poribacteria bacterium]
GKLLNRPPKVMITDKSGVDGIALWVNKFLSLKGESKASKTAVVKIARWVRDQYDTHGRITAISEEELVEQVKVYMPDHFDKEK